MKSKFEITLKNGSKKVYRNYANFVKFIINNYQLIENTNDEVTNSVMLKAR